MIAPGGQTNLDVGVDAARILNTLSTQKTILITSNDPKQASQVLKIKARFAPAFVVEPSTLDFSQIKQGEHVQKTAVLRQMGDSSVEITKVVPEATCKALEVSYKQLPKKNWHDPKKPEYLIVAETTAFAPVGSFKTQFIIETSCARMQKYACHAQGTIISFFTMLPTAVVDLGDVHFGDSKPDMLGVMSDEPLEIRDIVSSNKAIEVTVRYAENQRPYMALFNIALKDIPDQDASPSTADLSFVVVGKKERHKQTIPVQWHTAPAPPAPPAGTSK